MSPIDTLPAMRDVITENDLAARKSLGQNFLLDLNLTAKIARHAGSLESCDILEIGPGPGGLTRGLLAEGARFVLAIEKDRRCLPALMQIEQVYPERCKILEGDALVINPTQNLTAPIKIVANLPYNIGTELLIRWLTPT
ncbi:MAG: rRNA adenine N-6-methyltransferase family protein, partial [Paracoccaceae bacterium]|nr:rRNA adenine N-6-methyltransferase family protein [Paracoccaceae bacterium]